MTARIATALTFALLAGCSKPAGLRDDPSTVIAAVPASALSPYQTLIIGPNRQTAITNIPPTYHLQPASGVRLDISQFHSQYDTSAIAPDMVQIVLESGIYKLFQPQVTNFYYINPATLQPLRGPPFKGFRSGDDGMLAIGRTKPERSDSDSFSVTWVAKFQVK